jgi:hypothetical protein
MAAAVATDSCRLLSSGIYTTKIVALSTHELNFVGSMASNRTDHHWPTIQSDCHHASRRPWPFGFPLALKSFRTESFSAFGSAFDETNSCHYLLCFHQLVAR